MRDDHRGRWQVIHESLGGYHPEALASVLREYLVPRVPGGVPEHPEPERQALLQGVLRLLEEHAGAWYSEAGVQLGNESFTHYCLCHSFFRYGRPPDLGVETNIRRILDALDVAHGWLKSLDAHFQSLTLPKEPAARAAALAEGAVRVIDLTVAATDCNESWYHYALDAVLWMLEAQGLRVSMVLAAEVETALFSFRSWQAPTPAESRRAADAVALAALGAAPARQDVPGGTGHGPA